MTSYLNNGYEVMNYFAKFEKFLPHSIIVPSFMTVGSQLPELDRGAFCPPPPPYKIGGQNTPYKLGLSVQEEVFWDPPKISGNIEGSPVKLCTLIALLKVYQNT